jgi:hypothetical protein
MWPLAQKALTSNISANKWHLFIDFSQSSLKAVLLHNGNKYLSVPVIHTIKMKKQYENIYSKTPI